MIPYKVLLIAATLILVACKPDATQRPNETAQIAPVTEAHPAPPAAVDATLPAPPTAPWPTDAPLRKGMDAIALAVKTANAAKSEGRFGPAEARGLAGAIQQNFKFMTENCKLEPDADAGLHALVSRLLKASTALESDPQRTAEFDAMNNVLVAYPRYFDHPDWK